MARDANNEILSRRDFNKLVCCLAEEIGGGASLPAGTLNDTLRYDGTNWVASSALTNDGTRLGVENGVTIGTPATSLNAPLHIESNTEGAIVIRRLDNATAGARIQWNAGLAMTTSNNDGFRLFPNSGIGVTSPTSSYWKINLQSIAFDIANPTYAIDVSNLTTGIRFAQGTTAQRPTHAAGVMRWNSDTGSFEFSDGAAWNNFAVGTLPSGTDAQTLRFNGTSLTANSFMTNSGTVIKINNPINSSGNAPLTINTRADEGIIITRADNATSGGQIAWTDSAGSGLKFGATGNDGFYFYSNTGLGSFSGNYWRIKGAGIGYNLSNPAYALDVSGLTTGIRFTNGTTAQRPTHGAGVLRWNTDTSAFEYSDGTTWDSLGGGLVNWTEGFDSTTQATSSFTPLNAATDVNAAIVPKGTGALVLSIPDGTVAGGNARGQNAIDLQITRTAADQVTSGDNSCSIGQNNRNIGGSTFAIGVDNVLSNSSSYVIGINNLVTRTLSFALGRNNTIGPAGIRSYIIGEGNSNQGDTSYILGANSVAAAASYNSVILGNRAYGDVRNSKTWAGDRFAVNGDRQEIVLSMGADVTGDTESQLFLDNTSLFPGISDNTFWSGTIICTAITTTQGTGGTALVGAGSAHFKDFLIKRVAGTTSVVGSGDIGTPIRDSGMASDAFSVNVDDLTDELIITYTPPAGAAGDTVTRAHALVRINHTEFPGG